jgi:hypothetical protein
VLKKEQRKEIFDKVPFDLEKARTWLDRVASKGALDAQSTEL